VSPATRVLIETCVRHLKGCLTAIEVWLQQEPPAK